MSFDFRHFTKPQTEDVPGPCVKESDQISLQFVDSDLGKLARKTRHKASFEDITIMGEVRFGQLTMKAGEAPHPLPGIATGIRVEE